MSRPYESDLWQLKWNRSQSLCTLWGCCLILHQMGHWHSVPGDMPSAHCVGAEAVSESSNRTGASLLLMCWAVLLFRGHGFSWWLYLGVAQFDHCTSLKQGINWDFNKWSLHANWIPTWLFKNIMWSLCNWLHWY